MRKISRTHALFLIFQKKSAKISECVAERETFEPPETFFRHRDAKLCEFDIQARLIDGYIASSRLRELKVPARVHQAALPTLVPVCEAGCTTVRLLSAVRWMSVRSAWRARCSLTLTML